MLTHRRGDFSLCLPISPHDTPYIFIPHTSSWKPHQPTTYDAEPIRTIGLAIRIPYFNSFRLLLCHSNHSAFNSHNFPRPYTTTYLFSMLLCHSNRHTPTRGALRFGNYRSRLLSFLWPYSQPSFMLSFSSPPAIGLFRCRFSSGLCTTPCGITRHPSCHCVFSIFSLLAGIARCTSLGVCGRCRIRTCDGNRIFYFCLRPLSQPSCFVCCYGIATITSPSSAP